MMIVSCQIFSHDGKIEKKEAIRSYDSPKIKF